MITILSNVGNAGFALPMVQAYPTDVNLQYMLAWNPTAQALDYVPYVGNALGDFTVARDLSVTRDMQVTRNAGVLGNLAVAGIFNTVAGQSAAIPNIASGLQIDGVGLLKLASATGQLQVNATKVVGARATGWAAMTGTPDKTTKATGTVTLPQLAGIVMALQADLIAHGLIGP